MVGKLRLKRDLTFEVVVDSLCILVVVTARLHYMVDDVLLTS
jgi:hypothetical protein